MMDRLEQMFDCGSRRSTKFLTGYGGVEPQKNKIHYSSTLSFIVVVHVYELNS